MPVLETILFLLCFYILLSLDVLFVVHIHSTKPHPFIHSLIVSFIQQTFTVSNLWKTPQTTELDLKESCPGPMEIYT